MTLIRLLKLYGIGMLLNHLNGIFKAMELDEKTIEETIKKHEILWSDPLNAERLITFEMWTNAAKHVDLIDVFNDPADSEKCQKLYDAIHRGNK